MAPLDHDLVAFAASALSAIPANDGDHTVTAAARTSSGVAFAGANVFHFTGGPCAELVALGAAAAQGVLAKDITTMVAVRRDEGRIRVLNPCGRCRQVLLDYNPDMNVIFLDETGAQRMVPVRGLLPFAYVYGDGPDGQDTLREVAAA
ncbi:cytidine and deoxycytidylate deaminase zinc-binding region domain-containing protein [Purpureocillium lavendulum]|uniref:Cytidine and deoxycytidylate deaminase zinc-binding region domain-containing protein n=1 Tax=Purpureocillium lavendulum TaxID=1247861 RepID=A0AB34FVT4_9HYPO|nr:cytidine and deoxycytidylate deaminase zinc-binding region domain-containing protein [Purpureocillium lavendulum]